MNRIMKLAMAVTLSFPLLITGCSQKEVNDITSQSKDITSQAAEGLKTLGSSAFDIANKTVNDIKGYINKEKDGSVTDKSSLEESWNKLKEKFNEMAESAKTEEIKGKINDALSKLEEQFNALSKDLENNKDVASAKTAITNFWNSALEKLNELMK
ncbi:MAG: hypothetical protein QMB63_03885 [Clostridiaceae bacterium]